MQIPSHASRANGNTLLKLTLEWKNIPPIFDLRVASLGSIFSTIDSEKKSAFIAPRPANLSFENLHQPVEKSAISERP